MADLSEAGFLEQTHTSSGRIPTPEAYRLLRRADFRQRQARARQARPAGRESMISDSLAGISDVQEFMERTSHVLSLISRKRRRHRRLQRN